MEGGGTSFRCDIGLLQAGCDQGFGSIEEQLAAYHLLLKQPENLPDPHLSLNAAGLAAGDLHAAAEDAAVGRHRAVRDRLGVERHDLGGDHTPMLSQPDRLGEALLAETTIDSDRA